MNTPATRPAAAVAERDRLMIEAANIATILDTPFLLLPAELQVPTMRVWMTHRHLKGMESGVSLAAMLSVWMDEFGLTAADARRALRLMLSPAAIAGHKYSSDLTSHLGDVVEKMIARQEQLKEQAERRTPEDRAKIKMVADMKAEFGMGIDD